jgi:hypothetical protein
MGYPLKLVSCKQHEFVRWDEVGGERFNVEANETGVSTPPDDHYRTGLYESPPELEKRFCFLQSMSPRMELGGFLAQRSLRWRELERYEEAFESFHWVAALVPQNEAYSAGVRVMLRLWCEKECGRTRRAFGLIAHRIPTKPRLSKHSQ